MLYVLFVVEFLTTTTTLYNVTFAFDAPVTAVKAVTAVSLVDAITLEFPDKKLTPVTSYPVSDSKF